MKSWKEKLKRFRDRYSIGNLLTLSMNLLQNLMNTVLESGSILLKMSVLPILLLLILFVHLLRGLKWLISNLFDLLVDTINFIISLIVGYVSEISFYWRLLARVSIWTNLVFRYLFDKLLESLSFQLRKLADDQANLTTKYDKGYGEVNLESITRLFLWLWTLVLAIVMSVGIFVLVLFPVSIFVRKHYEQGQFYQNDFYTQFYKQPEIPLGEEVVLSSENQPSPVKRYLSTVIFLALVISIIGGYYLYSWFHAEEKPVPTQTKLKSVPPPIPVVPPIPEECKDPLYGMDHPDECVQPRKIK
jgi:hypothetical protein